MDERTGMRLYIGGYAQGKLRRAAERFPDFRILQGETDELPEDAGNFIFNHFHLWFRRHFLKGEDPVRLLDTILGTGAKEASKNGSADCHGGRDFVIIADEVGCGIIPAEEQDRAYREALGRCLILLAEKAEEVQRVYCGLSERIK